MIESFERIAQVLSFVSVNTRTVPCWQQIVKVERKTNGTFVPLENLGPHRKLTAYQENADVARRQPSQRKGHGASLQNLEGYGLV